MFLKELNEKEGNAFINLVKNLATIDQNFAREEENLIKEYMDEIGICPKCIEALNEDEALKVLSESNNKIKNIVYFEILGLALVDGDFSEKEVQFVDKIAKAFGIKEEKVKEFLGFFRDVNFMYEVTYSDHEDKIIELEKIAKDLI